MSIKESTWSTTANALLRGMSLVGGLNPGTVVCAGVTFEGATEWRWATPDGANATVLVMTSELRVTFDDPTLVGRNVVAQAYPKLQEHTYVGFIAGRLHNAWQGAK
jgi:hypothetical protein